MLPPSFPKLIFAVDIIRLEFTLEMNGRLPSRLEIVCMNGQLCPLDYPMLLALLCVS